MHFDSTNFNIFVCACLNLFILISLPYAQTMEWIREEGAVLSMFSFILARMCFIIGTPIVLWTSAKWLSIILNMIILFCTCSILVCGVHLKSHANILLLWIFLNISFMFLLEYGKNISQSNIDGKFEIIPIVVFSFLAYRSYPEITSVMMTLQYCVMAIINSNQND